MTPRQPKLFDVDAYPARTEDRKSTRFTPQTITDQGVQLKLVVGPQSLVEEFHLAFGLPISSEPTIDIPPTLAHLRIKLVQEEASELVDAITRADLAGIAGELADLLYVTYGTALTFGIDLDMAVEEIHRSNMSKLDAEGNPLIRDDGKVIKGPSYEPPNLERVITRTKDTAPVEARASRRPTPS